MQALVVLGLRDCAVFMEGFQGGHLPVVESPALFLLGQSLPRRLVRCVHRATILPLLVLYHAAASGSSAGSKSPDIRRKGALSCRFWLWSVPRVNAENIYKTSNTTKKHPRLPVYCSGCRGRRLRYIFLLNRGSALEAHLDAVVPHDDGLDQRLHDAAVPVVGGVAFLEPFRYSRYMRRMISASSSTMAYTALPSSSLPFLV